MQTDAIKTRVKGVASTAGKKLVDALERADELGGDARDWILARVDESERAQKAIAQLKKLRKKSHADAIAETRERVAEQEASRKAAEAEDAPPPTQEELAAEEASKGLGDPGIPAQIYGRTSCPWTGRAITLLENKKVDYDYVDLDDPDNEHFEGQLVPETKQNTVPYVYVRGEFLGGFDALDELERLGVLDHRLKSKAEREKDPAMQNVVVPKRENTDERRPGEVEDGPR